MNGLPGVKHAARNKYAWPGGYPLYVVMNDGGALCCGCARSEYRLIASATRSGDRSGWDAAGCDVNWENTDLTCDHCGVVIESAYGEP